MKIAVLHTLQLVKQSVDIASSWLALALEYWLVIDTECCIKIIKVNFDSEVFHHFQSLLLWLAWLQRLHSGGHL